MRGAASALARMVGKETDKPSECELMTVILSVLERIIFLKQVTFFQSMTIDQLKALASICEEEFIPKNITIFG